MMKDVLEHMFNRSGRNIIDYLDIQPINPLYRIVYGNGKEFYPSSDHLQMNLELERVFPGNISGYNRFMQKESKKFNILFDCLKQSYLSPKDFLRKELIRALPHLGANESLFDILGNYFNDDDLKMAFTFQAKYLGMSPWDCPGGYSIISYIEHAGGVHHVMGGFGKISEAMAKIIKEEGGSIHLNTPVRELIIENNNKVVGVNLENCSKHYSDYTIINADFSYAMEHLVKDEYKRKYTRTKIEKSKYSCSTFMLYLGVNKVYYIPHHNIIFSNNYKNNIEEISDKKILSEDLSIYIQNAVITDNNLVPKNKSSIYVLVPVPNNISNIDWDLEKMEFKEKVLNILEQRAGLSDIREHIEAERMFTPLDWENEMAVYRGAVFNLGHNISQMLYFRPHNRFEEFINCYLVGGGTHPGSGLPTIFESARITSDLILSADGKSVPIRNEYSELASL